MSINFRKSKKIGDFIRLNFSKSGVSATIGIPGLSINIGKNGMYLNCGLPGTGLSTRKKLKGKRNEAVQTAD
jgi:hypothetical protein